MRKEFKKAGLAMLSAVLVMGSSMMAYAQERTYTYNYDYWGDVQDAPDSYDISGVYTTVDLGIEGKLKSPEGLFVDGQNVYICDTGNNRILHIKRISNEKFELVREITTVKGANPSTFSNPTDIALDEDGNIFVADKSNGRVVKMDQDCNYLMQFVKPNDSTLDEGLTYLPNKIVVDTAGRVYCIATGVNKGLIKYENDGTFSGFVGATKVTYDFADYLQKKFATQEQRAQMVSFVPTEYDNLFIDKEGFIYACTGKPSEDDLKSESADAVRKLNLLGNDILVRNGNWPVYGDLYWGEGGGYKGPSYFADVTAFDNDVYVCLDKNRGRVFGYDDQGRMVFAFGGNGNMDGYFRQPVAVDHMGYDILVLDTLDCSITLFTPTEFGTTVYDAMDYFDKGEYEASGAAWQKAMDINGNYDLAYIGLGRAHLRQKEYKEAMDYFELKYDRENYSKAFKQYRKIWVEDHIVQIIIVILALVLIPAGINKVKAIKHEIATADIFKL